jgi:Transglycosylase
MSVETPSNIPPLFSDDEGPGRTPPRLRTLRLVAILIPLSLLAVVSTLFGMMMAVASDPPDLENAREFQSARNWVLVDLRGRQLGVLTNNHSRILVSYGQIAPSVRNAVIAIEDRRFYENPGVDLRGIARALVRDIIHQQAVQGGSTSTQQFVKNALRAQNDRTIFQKMREAALAYHLTRKWSKGKIPHAVPELDLLRERRLRDRGRRPDVLRARARARGVRHTRAPVRGRAEGLGGGAAGRDHRLAGHLRPGRPPGRRPRPPRPRPGAHVRAGWAVAPGPLQGPAHGAARARRGPAAAHRVQGALLRDLGPPATRRPVRRATSP